MTATSNASNKQSDQTSVSSSTKMRSNLGLFWRSFRQDKAALLALGILIVLISAAILAPLVAPHPPNQTGIGSRLEGPSASHWFGTDSVGRDILSRVIHGGRLSLSIGFLAVAIGLSVGCLLGLLAGYFRSLDNLIMRLMDILLALPGILLAIGIVAALGAGTFEVTVAVGVGAVPVFARVTRSAVLRVREEMYVESARAAGCGHFRLVFRHILPNSFAPIIIYGTLSLASAILTVSILSFLGLGPQPPAPEWGAMVNEGRSYMIDSPHSILFPGFAIFLTVFAFNLLGDGLRDALDPRLQTR